MKIVYGAQGAIDAQRVVDRLAFEGIAANVLDGYLAGAAGELPMAGLVNVWVADEDEARARALLAAAEIEAALPPLIGAGMHSAAGSPTAMRTASRTR